MTDQETGWGDHRDRVTGLHYATCYDHLTDEQRQDRDDLASMYAEDGLRNMDGRLVLIGCVAPYAGRRCPPGRREHRMYVQTTNGYGDLVRPIREHNGARYATVRTSSGAWVSGRVLRIWSDADAATRDYYNAEQRKRAREHRERAR